MHAMAEGNGHNGLLGMGKDIFSLVADCTNTKNGRSKYREWPDWDEWIRVPLELMVEEGDERAERIRKSCVTFSESKAAVLGIAEELLALVLRQAPEKVRTDWLQAALKDALGSGNLDMTIRLLDNSELSKHVCGARTLHRCPWTLLHAAVKGGGDDPALVNALLRRGAKADLDTCAHDEYLNLFSHYSNQSPLHYAAYFGHSRVVQALISAGATVDLLNVHGCSPLTNAIEKNNVDAARVLLSSGASPNDANRNVRNSFCAASSEMAEILLAAGFDASAGDDAGWTPLHHSASMGSSGNMGALLGAGANLNAQDKAGKTPLRIACENVFVLRIDRAVEELLRLGADDTISDNYGQSPADAIRTALAVEDRPGHVSDWPYQVRKHDCPYQVRKHDCPMKKRILATLTKHRAWRRRGWLLMLRQRVDPGGVVGAAGWVVRCPEEGVFRTILEFL